MSNIVKKDEKETAETKQKILQPNSFYDKIERLETKIKKIGNQNLQSLREQFQQTHAVKETEEETDWTFNVLYLICLFLFAILIIFISAFFVKILWNYLVFSLIKDPQKTPPPYLSWLSAANLLVLVRILFF